MYLDIRYSGIAKYQNTYWNSTDSIKKKKTEYTTSTLRNTGQQLRTIKVVSGMDQFSNEFMYMKPHNNLKSTNKTTWNLQ